MITRLAVALIVLWVATCPARAALADARELKITHVSREGDEAFIPQRSYTGLVLRNRFPVLDAIRVALKEARVVGRALGMTFSLEELKIGPDQSAADTLEAYMAGSGSRILVLDLPIVDTRAVVAKFAASDLVFFNPRHRDDDLRGADCQANLLHTIASRGMIMDAFGQFLRKMNWGEVLLLQGEDRQDKPTADAFVAAARKFGISITERKSFTLSNDPRRRDQNNVALMTQGRYDAVFVSDAVGDFGRSIAYQTALPRPVIGDHGLRASGWHWAWERHGAPQLNQRFNRLASRNMSETDWAGWAAVKAVVEAAARTGSTASADLLGYLRSEAFVLDGYKGTPSSFRAWNNQLRQPILLHTHDAVIQRAPLDGFLHQTNVLDTLGTDQPDSACNLTGK